MEINTKVLNENNIETSGEITSMKLDETSQAMVFQMFTGGLYSDPIGTVIREITSNCFDSHIEAGVDAPVIVRMSKEVGGNYISFIDSGVGMSPERVKDVFGVYFKSTKQNTNSQIGGFGLGGKTPLAYAESFFIVTRYNGVEYVYNIFEGNNVPAIELISQTSTDQHNGTEVKVPVKAQDVDEFERKTLRQLYYFENVVFEGFSEYVTNDYTIYNGNSFKLRGTDYSSYVHISYGNVAYPLDFEAVGLDRNVYQIPIALKIEIGELEGTGVTPSREAIKYSKHNVQIIKRKLNEAIDELIGMYSKQNENVVSLLDYYKAIGNKGILLIGNTRINISKHVKKTESLYTNFKFKDLKIPSENFVLEYFYSIKLFGKKPTRYTQTRWDSSISGLINRNNIYLSLDFKRVNKKQSYLKSLSQDNNFYVVTENEFINHKNLGILTNTSMNDASSFELDTYTLFEDDKAEAMVLEFKSELETILLNNVAGIYEDVEIPEDFQVRKKTDKLSKEELKGKINYKNMAHGYRNVDTLERFTKYNGKIYYGFRDDTDLLSNSVKYHDLLSDKNANSFKTGTMFIQISKQNEKHMKALGKKAKHISMFNRVFLSRKYEMITDNMANGRLRNRYHELNEIFRNSNLIKEIDKDLYESHERIKSFLNKNNITSWVFDLLVRNAKTIFSNIEECADNKIKLYESDFVKLETLSKNKLLNWVSIPYYFDASSEDHMNCVELIKKII